jgi:hypothetical protein
MANHAVVNAAKISAQTVESFVRPVVSSGCDIDNGNVFTMVGKYSTSGSGMEVWSAVVPATGSLVGVWMALEPEIPSAYAGTKQYRGLGTVRDFYNAANQVFTAVKLQPGDIFSITDDGLKGSHSTGSYICTTDGELKWLWAAFPAPSAAYARFLNTVYFSIPDGSISDQRVTAYQFEVVANS